MPAEEVTKKLEVFRQRIPSGHVAVSAAASDLRPFSLVHNAALIKSCQNIPLTIPFSAVGQKPD